jgi:hypothetical protein
MNFAIPPNITEEGVDEKRARAYDEQNKVREEKLGARRNQHRMQK